MTELLHADITEQILGAAFEVHAALGPGFLESIYEEAICYELKVRGLEVDRQVRVPVFYKKFEVGTHVLDLIVLSCHETYGRSFDQFRSAECEVQAHCA